MKIAACLFIFFPGILLQAQKPDTLWQRSLRCYEQQNFHGAIANADTLLNLTPDFSEAFDLRGIARIGLGDIESACNDLTQAQNLESGENRRFTEFLCNPEFIRDVLLKQYYKKVAVSPETGYRPLYTRADSLRGALRPERTCFDVYFYDLQVKIIPGRKKIEGSNLIYFHVVNPTRKIQIDLFDNYQVTSISWNGNELTWHREYNALFIDFPQELPAGQNHILKIAWQGKPETAPNPPWDGGFVWKRDEHKKLWLGVACEYLGASSWWPNKDHFTDKPDSVKIALEVPKGYQAVSNGDLEKVEPTTRKYNRFTWLVEYPINNYNVTFYVGKYTAFSDTLIQHHDTLKLDYNVLTYNLDKAKEHFKQTLDVVSFYNKAFGFYPFAKDGFGLVESPYEGMEHQSAIAYGHGYNKNSNQEYRNQLYDYIIVHEAAHEWWGNSVTASDMADIWIHEGFATYAEYLFLENKFGKDEYMYELTDKSQYIFNVWPMVQHRDVNENTFAGNDVYNKGAMMLHCLRCSINNDSLFFNIIRDFCISNRYKTVNSNDFVAFVNQNTGADHTAFFKKYLTDTRLPILEYAFSRDSNNLVVKYRWTGVEEGFVMPFGIATSKKESMRIVADSSWKEIRLAETEWFNFYNLWKGYEGCPDNAFTYFNTRWVN
jgi:aminopeptidase N